MPPYAGATKFFDRATIVYRDGPDRWARAQTPRLIYQITSVLEPPFIYCQTEGVRPRLTLESLLHRGATQGLVKTLWSGPRPKPN